MYDAVGDAPVALPTVIQNLFLFFFDSDNC